MIHIPAMVHTALLILWVFFPFNLMDEPADVTCRWITGYSLVDWNSNEMQCSSRSIWAISIIMLLSQRFAISQQISGKGKKKSLREKRQTVLFPSPVIMRISEEAQWAKRTQLWDTGTHTLGNFIFRKLTKTNLLIQTWHNMDGGKKEVRIRCQIRSYFSLNVTF